MVITYIIHQSYIRYRKCHLQNMRRTVGKKPSIYLKVQRGWQLSRAKDGSSVKHTILLSYCYYVLYIDELQMRLIKTYFYVIFLFDTILRKGRMPCERTKEINGYPKWIKSLTHLNAAFFMWVAILIFFRSLIFYFYFSSPLTETSTCWLRNMLSGGTVACAWLAYNVLTFTNKTSLYSCVLL